MTNEEEVTPATVLREAADLIEPEGAWLQWKMTERDKEGNLVAFCALGGIRQALYSKEYGKSLSSFIIEIEQAARDAVADLDEISCAFGIASWNDDLNRTQQEVVDTLRLAAKRWEEENV